MHVSINALPLAILLLVTDSVEVVNFLQTGSFGKAGGGFPKAYITTLKKARAGIGKQLAKDPKHTQKNPNSGIPNGCTWARTTMPSSELPLGHNAPLNAPPRPRPPATSLMIAVVAFITDQLKTADETPDKRFDDAYAMPYDEKTTQGANNVEMEAATWRMKIYADSTVSKKTAALLAKPLNTEKSKKKCGNADAMAHADQAAQNARNSEMLAANRRKRTYEFNQAVASVRKHRITATQGVYMGQNNKALSRVAIEAERATKATSDFSDDDAACNLDSCRRLPYRSAQDFWWNARQEF